MVTLDRGNLGDSVAIVKWIRPSFTFYSNIYDTPERPKASMAGAGEGTGDWGTLEGDSLFKKRKRSMIL